MYFIHVSTFEKYLLFSSGLPCNLRKKWNKQWLGRPSKVPLELDTVSIKMLFFRFRHRKNTL